MKSCKNIFVTLMIILGATLSYAMTPVFDSGTLSEGSLFASGSAGGTATIVNTETYLGNDTIQYDPNGGAWSSGGLGFWGREMTIPVGENAIEILYLSHAGSVGSQIYVDTSAGNYVYNDSNSADWTVNGSAGARSALTADTWHTIVLDLTAIAGFTPGTTQLTGKLSIQNSTADQEIYFGAINLIPEPSTLGLLAISALALGLFRRRR